MQQQNCWIDEFASDADAGADIDADADSSSTSSSFSSQGEGGHPPEVPMIEVTRTNTSLRSPDRRQQRREVEVEVKDPHTESKAFLDRAYTRGKIHDCLCFNNGLAHFGVLGWKVMEYLPFRRMDLQPDGSWKAIIWPLPRGEVRDIPENVRVHTSVLKRMQADPK